MISIIVPVFNEEARKNESIPNLLSTLKILDRDWELIAINDGSTDMSLEILHKIAKQNKRLRVISYSINKGRGKALRVGFSHARGDIIITTEADSSWGDGIIFSMIKKLEENNNYDFVIASPHIDGGGYKNVPYYRSFLSKYGNKILRKAFANKITMATGMTRCYRGKIIKSLLLESDGKEVHLEILSKLLILGYQPVEIPAILEWKKDKKGKKRRSSFNAKKLILSHLLFSFTELPWLLFGSLGYFFIALGIFLGVITQFHHFIYGYSPSRPPFVNPALITLLIIVGLQIILVNFIALQNKKTYGEIIKLQKEVIDLKEKNVPKICDDDINSE